MAKQLLAKYPNLSSHRLSLGWDISDLRAKMERPVSEKTLKRLEEGFAIRAATTHRVFNAIQDSFKGDLIRETEVVHT